MLSVHDPALSTLLKMDIFGYVVTYHRVLQLLSCFNVYLILNVSVFITQDLLYFPFPSERS